MYGTEQNFHDETPYYYHSYPCTLESWIKWKDREYFPLWIMTGSFLPLFFRRWNIKNQFPDINCPRSCCHPPRMNRRCAKVHACATIKTFAPPRWWKRCHRRHLHARHTHPFHVRCSGVRRIVPNVESSEYSWHSAVTFLLFSIPNINDCDDSNRRKWSPVIFCFFERDVRRVYSSVDEGTDLWRREDENEMIPD